MGAEKNQSGAPTGRNSENVRLIPFDGQGKSPTVLVGRHILAATPSDTYPLIFTTREGNQRQFQIHSTVTGRYFAIQTCALLKRHLSRVGVGRPSKVIAAASGRKEVVYAAPFCAKKRRLYGKKQVDIFNLIGLQLEGMSEMGWIWAEDMRSSFEEGVLRASVYIGFSRTSRKHTLRLMTTEEDQLNISSEVGEEDNDGNGGASDDSDTGCRTTGEGSDVMDTDLKGDREEGPEPSEAGSMDDMDLY
ncbi:hypothetical protein DRE_00928 [Drechslerella stenobrocha 248]|uniref:Uncharacterized protein n=1 Tax=Drechslerella stenobrocha 248 TaxID=1043628 RepID=W7HNZ3_9PEZI|nr:hypothetical protein DRE_00928 [Drechslerella stenobrocha 248]